MPARHTCPPCLPAIPARHACPEGRRRKEEGGKRKDEERGGKRRKEEEGGKRVFLQNKN